MSEPDPPPTGSPIPTRNVRKRLRRWLPSAFAGLAAVILGLGASELAAALIAPAASPVLVVGSLLIDAAPAWAKETAIALFGTGDKAALLTGLGIALAVVAGAAGVLERWKTPFGRVVIGAAGVVGVGAAITRNGSAAFDIIPAAVATVVALITLGVLLRAMDEPTRPRPINPALFRATGGRPANALELERAAEAQRREAARLTRRKFLGLTSGAVALGAVTAFGGYALQAGARAATAARNALTLPAPSVKAAAIPAGADLGIDGMPALVVKNTDFYRIDTALQIPQIDPTQWELTITGMVANPITITFAELLKLPLEESYTTLMCVSNEVGGNLIGNARWLGYPIRHLLARAQPKAGADMVFSRSSDGFTASTPLSVLQDERNAILAVGMNGEPLPAEHGYPVRMVVPGLYGYVSATKWVVELEVTKFSAHSAYWTQRGWSARGPVKVESEINVPQQGTTVKAGTVAVAGIAWHQHTGIQKVEVQVDNQAWAEADLAPAISIDTWVQWKYAWSARSGQHTLRVRATSADGQVQTSDIADTVPDGATGYHEVQVQVG
jgi:DMSO/TMAO reductase YedYZ molybdopterin-dependent catalytic subunit